MRTEYLLVHHFLIYIHRKLPSYFVNVHQQHKTYLLNISQFFSIQSNTKREHELSRSLAILKEQNNIGPVRCITRSIRVAVFSFDMWRQVACNPGTNLLCGCCHWIRQELPGNATTESPGIIHRTCNEPTGEWYGTATEIFLKFSTRK